MDSEGARKYDLVIVGATGFTGSLVCEYLLQSGDKSVHWAIAGRNLRKLDEVKERLIKLDESAKDLDTLIVDATQPETLAQVVATTRVILSTVGPFTKYGTPLVEACVQHKTHYVDITGEFGWIKTIIDRFHEEAKRNHVMVVPACGLDSIPSDLGTFMTCDYLRTRHGLQVSDVKASVVEINSGVSGGTLQSCIEAMTDNSLPLKAAIDPYLLSPVRGLEKPSVPWLRRDRDFGNKWQSVWAMAMVNEKVVRRSWGLWTERGRGYGRLFRYTETISLPFLPAFLMTSFFLAFTPILSVVLRIGWLRRLVQKCLPAGGTGPSRQQLESGHFQLQFVATAETEPYDEPVRAKGTVKGFRDPGYGDTCRMVVESALCIIKSYDQLPGKDGGVLTSSTAFGHVLIDRLTKDGGMVFEVKDMQ